MVEKIEANAVKVTGINIEHIEIGSIDIGVKGKQNFVGLILIGIIFYILSILPLGQLALWFQLFYVLSFAGAIIIFMRIHMCFEKIKRVFSLKSKEGLNESEQLRFYDSFHKLREFINKLTVPFLVFTILSVVISALNLSGTYSLILITYIFSYFVLITITQFRNYYELPKHIDVSISLKKIINDKIRLSEPLTESDVVQINQLFSNLYAALDDINPDKLLIEEEKENLIAFKNDVDYLESFILISKKETFKKLKNDLNELANAFNEKYYIEFVRMYPNIIKKINDISIIERPSEEKKPWDVIWDVISSDKTKSGLSSLTALAILLIIIYLLITGRAESVINYFVR